MAYFDRLRTLAKDRRTQLCVGLDPDPERIDGAASGALRHCREVVRQTEEYACCFKPNSAFWEQYGPDGWKALLELHEEFSDTPFLLDAKRGDMDNTMRAYARAVFQTLAMDAATVSPYLGEEAIAPLLDRPDRFAYVLCRTSNPGAHEIQDLEVAADASLGAPAEPLWARVARRAAAWGGGGIGAANASGTVGLVVGATAPAELAAVRNIAPGLAFLVPGVGAQGGDIGRVLDAGPARAEPAGGRPGGGLLVNVSRGIAGAATTEKPGGPSDAGERLAKAAADWAGRLPVLS